MYQYESLRPTLGCFYSCRHMKVTACMIYKNSLALTLGGAPWLLLAQELHCQAASLPDFLNYLDCVRASCWEPCRGWLGFPLIRGPREISLQTCVGLT